MATNMNYHCLANCPEKLIQMTRLLLVCALCFLIYTPLHAQNLNSLEDISFNTLPGNRLQIALRMAEPAAAPLSFTINDPARIALDLLETQNNLAQKTLPIGLGLARSIMTAEAKGRTRVVLNLTQLVPYSTEIDGNTIYLTLENEGGLSRETEITSSTAAIVGKATRAGPELDQGITGIDFRRGAKGEARIIVNLSNNNIPVDVNQEGGKIIVDFVRTGLPESLAHRLDVLDFATPAKTVDAFQNGNNTRIIVTPVDSNFEHLAYQSDEIFTLELKTIPKEVLEQKTKEKFGYTGERLSLNFQDIEVRSVLQLIADFTNLNVVVSDTVSGKLTLRLKNVPWDQALDIILNSKGLAQRKSGNVLLIAPTEEIATREKLELEALAQVQELAPLRSEYMQVNYAKASELAQLLTGDAGKGGLLTERGRVSIDQRTNMLLIQDTADKLEEVRSLITRLDIPVRQVLIESRIVIATDDFNKELGVRFGTLRSTIEDSNDGSIITGNQNALVNYLNGDEIPITDTLNVNLPTSASMGSLSLALARLPFGTLLHLELSAMQAEGRGEVISSPRVITANQKEAFIEQGVEIPYQQSTSSGATSVAFKKAVLSLTVTPQITPDDRIIMDLVVNNDTVGELFGIAQIPSVDTREVQTQVLVNNGETIVLGGIFEQIKRDQVDKIPFFGDLPGVGGLFRRTTKQDEKSELLIFVTPKIIRDNIALN
jgi:type IV pilus assembly protein PilQ